MIDCPECKKLNLENPAFRILQEACSLDGPRFKDYSGRNHNHQGLKFRTTYKCFLGHIHRKEELIGSCWCGWTCKQGDQNG